MDAPTYLAGVRPQRLRPEWRLRIRDADALNRLLRSYVTDDDAVFGVYLTLTQHLLGVECLLRGPLTDSALSAHAVFRPALRHNAATFCVAHTIPHGEAEPSPLDRLFTYRLARFAGDLGIPILDYLVIGRHGFVSQRLRTLADSPLTPFGHTHTYDTYAGRVTLGQPYTDTTLGYYTGEPAPHTADASRALDTAAQPLKTPPPSLETHG